MSTSRPFGAGIRDEIVSRQRRYRVGIVTVVSIAVVIGVLALPAGRSFILFFLGGCAILGAWLLPWWWLPGPVTRARRAYEWFVEDVEELWSHKAGGMVPRDPDQLRLMLNDESRPLNDRITAAIELGEAELAHDMIETLPEPKNGTEAIARAVADIQLATSLPANSRLGELDLMINSISDEGDRVRAAFALAYALAEVEASAGRDPVRRLSEVWIRYSPNLPSHVRPRRDARPE